MSCSLEQVLVTELLLQMRILKTNYGKYLMDKKPLIVIKNLVKKFGIHLDALNGVSLDVYPGECSGYVLGEMELESQL